jgi:hypothetical protein
MKQSNVAAPNEMSSAEFKELLRRKLELIDPPLKKVMERLEGYGASVLEEAKRYGDLLERQLFHEQLSPSDEEFLENNKLVLCVEEN